MEGSNGAARVLVLLKQLENARGERIFAAWASVFGLDPESDSEEVHLRIAEVYHQLVQAYKQAKGIEQVKDQEEQLKALIAAIDPSRSGSRFDSIQPKLRSLGWIGAVSALSLVLGGQGGLYIGQDALSDLQLKTQELKVDIHSWDGPPLAKGLLLDLVRRLERAIDDCRIYGPEKLLEVWSHLQNLEHGFGGQAGPVEPFWSKLRTNVGTAVREIGIRATSAVAGGLTTAVLLYSMGIGGPSAAELLEGAMQTLCSPQKSLPPGPSITDEDIIDIEEV